MNEGLSVTYRVFCFQEDVVETDGYFHDEIRLTNPVYPEPYGHEWRPFGLYASVEEAQAAIVQANRSDTFVIVPVYVFKAVP